MTVSKPKAPLSVESCCTCATLLCDVPRYSESEKPPLDRQLECCRRIICGNCCNTNPRFNTYCPYCQISTTDTTLPPGLRDPPSYESSVATGSSRALSAAPPPYTPSTTIKAPDPLDEKSVPLDSPEPAEDTLHFLDHAHDTIPSLSLRYGVPASALRRANNITSDHLILGRRTVIIPGEYYKGGVSLSPRPIEGEEEEARKSKIRRWQVACKVHEYDVAVLYLEQAGYDLQLATEAFFADEEWERAHPVEAARRGKGVAGRANNNAYWRGRR
ncbi:uncharacterized protein F4822DRAFT_14015 [Hypoxylon trugodes]|uniref:uncharacterized protein n=1 Tax=Hypoxylon trugodes TaxID=326681 RepID=UPI0021948DC1|nr:uncharacterized protein F4822DRAFT_14015 [Hypoxylon trugodes]KAI1393465.1 hypothetical protein F4822DRAFT_14015 [Hypoxylon trugodes]